MSFRNYEKNKHLMWRAGFGPAAAQLPVLEDYTHTELYQAMQKASAKKPAYIDVADDYFKGMVMGVQELGRQEKKEQPVQDKAMIRKENKQAIKNLNLYWLNEMTDSEAQLSEKMAFFWHGHFACRNLNVFYQQQLLDIIRTNALGSFRDLLHGVSKSAAMLNFLNNNQNRKGHPNENFAREVMELFTIGRGKYSEQDIKEAARAFTGWGASLNGEFVYRSMQHDDGRKIFFGKTGNFAGDEVLDILLEQKQTAEFITQKVYRFFVNENADAEKTEWLADRFYKNDYHIGKLMDDIFTSDWFYDKKNTGCKIKSPVELIVGIRRMLPMRFANEETLLLVQRILGQLLFYPPNVAGWPGGKTWIDSSSLMTRLRFPQLINDTDELTIQPKVDDDQQMGKKENDGIGTVSKTQVAKANGSARRQMNATIEWNQYLEKFDKVSKDNLIKAISDSLLQTSSTIHTEVIKKYAAESSRENFIKSVTIRIMSTPEYQLC